MGNGDGQGVNDSDTFFTDQSDWLALKKRTVSGSLYTGIGQFVRVILNLATQILLTRLLLPEQFGVVAMVLPIVAFIELFGTMGLANAVIQRDRISHADLNALYWFGMLVSMVLAAVLILSAPLIAFLYGEPRVTPIAIVLSALLPLSAIAGHASALMARQMKFASLAVVDVISSVGVLVAVGVSALLDAGYWAVVAGQIVGTGTRAFFDLLLSGWRPSRPRWSKKAGSMLRFGGQLSLFNIINYLSGYIDNILVGVLMGPGPLGLFDRSFALVLRPLASITYPISKVAVPLLSRAHGDDIRYRGSFMALAQSMMLLVTPGLVAASVLAQDVVLALLGPHWAGVTPMFSAISVAAMFVPISASSYWIFTSQDRVSEQVRIAIFSSGLVIASMLVALPWGVTAISISYAVVAPFVHGIYAWQAGCKGPVGRGDFVRMTVPIAAGAVCGAVLVALFARLPLDNHWLRLFFGLVIAYAGMVIGFGIFGNGRRVLHLGATLFIDRIRTMRRSADREARS